MKKTITFQGEPLTLVGRTVKVGDFAPPNTLVAQDLSEVNFLTSTDKIRVITTFPSLDTPVCDLQVKAFNKKAASLGSDVVVIGVSKDLPFAQKRFCELNTIENVKVLSDYKTSSLGINYGLLIKEWNLLARSVFIIDKTNTIRYMQLVEEVSNAPNYDEVIEALQQIIA